MVEGRGEENREKQRGEQATSLLFSLFYPLCSLAQSLATPSDPTSNMPRNTTAPSDPYLAWAAWEGEAALKEAGGKWQPGVARLG